MKKLLHLILIFMLAIIALPVSAQRKQQKLGRGVVVTIGRSNGSEAVAITWRRLAEEPEDAKFNIYVSKTIDGSYTLLNSTPQSTTFYSTTLSNVPYGSFVAVSMVSNGVESERSVPFQFKNNGLRNIYMEISYAASPLKMENYTTKFVWPCDLNGDGEMDYVVDRCPVDGSRNYFIEGYQADGTFLWTVDLGVNEKPCDGQNDNLCAYDIDCDGMGELIVQTSDGARFWDKDNGTWGKYLFCKDTADSDGDGIIDYDTQSTKNPPRYMKVVDGMTGAEKASAEFAYDEAYNRTNKASLMRDEYNKHEGHVGIFYYDGVHPAIVGEWHTRSADGNTHYYRNVAFAYVNGEWKLLFSKKTGGVVFHQIRIADVDGDGCDEMLSGEYAMDQDGSTLYNAHIAHGDRHRISDIDPERPGLECFSIQQNAGDMLGQILYDAATGEPIKKWYLSSVGDVGRGECMDIDKNHLGWEMWSTMDGVYDAKGDRIDGLTNVYPTEGIWWDGQLDREILQTSDSHYNFYVQDYYSGRLIEPAKESGYQLKTSYGKRAKFWGDIIGDWREELVVIREVNGVCKGIVGMTSDYKTSVNNIYCLQQDPHYRGDCTTRGYYQSPNPGFYLGYDMPRPQLPPCMVADESNEVFDITLGNATVSPSANMENIYFMPVKNQVLTVDNALDGSANIWKSQQGTTVLNKEVATTGNIIISEGTLEVNNSLSGNLELRARGTLSGSGSVDNISFEGALNYEGGRIKPTTILTFNNGLSINKKTYIELDIKKGTLLAVNGDLAVTASTIFTINTVEPSAGEYPLIRYTGSFSGKETNFSINGLNGISYNILNKDNAIILKINGQRQSADGVYWVGNQSSVWEYQTENWTLNDEATTFVANDGVIFNDNATSKTVKLNEQLPIKRVEIDTEKTDTFNGDGGFSGDGMLVKNGSGKLILNTTKNDYKGATVINSGSVTVKELSDAGMPSSIGAASASASNFQIGKATLIINNTNSSTDRGITLTDTATVSIASGTVSFKGIIQGAGTLQKNGSGQVNITYGGTNTWSGTILNAGTLAMGSWNTTFGKAASPMHIMGNATIAMFDNNTTSAIPSYQNVTTIDKDKTLTFKAGSRCTVKGSLLGEGTYKISFPYVRADVSTNCSKFEGTYDVMTSNCRFVQAMDLSKATLKLEEGAYAAGFKAGKGDEASYTHKIGTLTGAGTLGTGVWQISRLLVNYKTTRTSVSNDAVTVNGSATLNNITIDMQTTSLNEMPDNAEFVILKGSGKRAVTGTVTVLPTQPKPNFKWDTSRLASEGVISIVPDPTAIRSVSLSSLEDAVIFDLSGRQLDTISSTGIYIVNGQKVNIIK